MAATIEVNYFNSFWIKKMDSIVEVRGSTSTVTVTAADSATQTIGPTANTDLGIGQRVFAKDANGVDVVNFPQTVYLNGFNTTNPFTVTLSEPVSLQANDVLIFGEIEDFTEIPRQYTSDESDWYAEETRIRGGYNNTNVDLGVKAYLVEDNPNQNHRFNSMIYSGIFNSRTGVNNSNQFSVAESITRSVDPAKGSIQKLYAEDTNLVIFQELKVSKALIDKDAIYTQEGQALQAASNVVIGGIVPYAGEYGISTNPESFAVFGFRKYFADKNKNLILRLSQDGITEISSSGMVDYFRDKLSTVSNLNPVLGGWDQHNKQYALFMKGNTNETLSFDESVRGWTSRFSYVPDRIGSLRNNFYTYKDGNLWQHYSSNVNRASFYGVDYVSNVTLILNPKPSMVKVFKTINYEGAGDWVVPANGIITDQDTGLQISQYQIPTSLADLETSLFTNNFKRKENKYFANIVNVSAVTPGEVLFGQTMTGVKGFTSTITFSSPLQADGVTPVAQTTKKELFAVSSNYNQSSY